MVRGNLLESSALNASVLANGLTDAEHVVVPCNAVEGSDARAMGMKEKVKNVKMPRQINVMSLIFSC